MKKLKWLLIALMVATLGLTACTSNDTPPNNNGDKDDENKKEWATSIEDIMLIEGMEETITLELLEGENFVTYVPEDLLVETVSSGEGDVYWFYANFQGNKREDVSMQFMLFPKSDEKPDLIGEKGLFTAQGKELIANKEKIHQWSLEEFYSNEKEVFYVILGEHNGQFFTMTLSYPGEFGDGFGPRVNKIIEHLYWNTTNEYLAPR